MPRIRLSRSKGAETPAALVDHPIPALAVAPGTVLAYELRDAEDGPSTRSGCGVVGAVLLIALFIAPALMLAALLLAVALVAVPIALLIPAARRKIRAALLKRKHPLRVELDRNPIAPGEHVEGVVRLLKPGPLERLDISIISEETIAYRQGSDTHHDSAIVFERKVASFDGPGYTAERADPAPREHTFAFDCPVDAMHSFFASNNTVSWIVVVERRYANAAPVEDRGFFQVLPLSLLEAVVNERLGPTPIGGGD